MYIFAAFVTMIPESELAARCPIYCINLWPLCFL